MSCAEDVRQSCRDIASHATDVRIDEAALDSVAAGAVPALDPVTHFVDGPPEDVAGYILTLDALNFGSGWFHELPGFGYEHVARTLADLWRAGERPPHDEASLAALLHAPAGHELIGLYAQALGELDAWLGPRSALDVIDQAGGSAQQLAAMLAQMPMWADAGFLKRAQICANDLALAGVARFTDLDRLTAFADNVLPQVLRHDGVLVLSDGLAAHIDAGELLPPGQAETELRACAVHACELLAARWHLAPREVDNILWTRGQAYTDPPPHRTHTTFY